MLLMMILPVMTAIETTTWHATLQAGDLHKACAIARQDPGSDLAPTATDFQERVQSLAAQLLQVNLHQQCRKLCNLMHHS